jgi:hypothetical protein
VCSTSVVTGQGIASMPEPIGIHDFADRGVSLLPATAPQFDAQLTQLIPRWSDAAGALKPYLAILSNHSKRTIVAYSVSFDTTDGSGNTHQDMTHFNYPSAVAGTGDGSSGLPRDREVRPSEFRVVGAYYEIMPDLDNRWLTDFARRQSERLKDARTLEVGIDAVIFDDGSIIGEDTSGLQQAFEKYLNTTQQIYRSILSRVEGGSSISEAIEWLRGTADEARRKAATGDRDVFYYVQAVGDVSRARRSIGDDRMREVLANAIRRTPFVVKRLQ